MKKSKLLALTLALLISFGAITGSTIAWFTDEVTSANNIIKSGALDVDVYCGNPADKEKWSALTDGYFTNNPNFDLVKVVLQLVDSRIGPTADDEMMLQYLSQCGIPFIVVATKCDKLNRTERNSFIDFMKENMPEVPYILYSAKDGEGREDLWKAITEAVLA